MYFNRKKAYSSPSSTDTDLRIASSSSSSSSSGDVPQVDCCDDDMVIPGRHWYGDIITTSALYVELWAPAVWLKTEDCCWAAAGWEGEVSPPLYHWTNCSILDPPSDALLAVAPTVKKRSCIIRHYAWSREFYKLFPENISITLQHF